MTEDNKVLNENISSDTPRRITILGSTGSIGTSTIDLIERDPSSYRVEALTAYRNVDLLAEQARKFDAQFVAIGDYDKYADLKKAMSGSNTEVAAGPEAIVEAAARDADWVMAGIVGSAGLEPTLEAARQGAVVAFANKECLVCAGDLMLDEIARSGATLLPVDSEHNAIFQVFEFDRRETIEKIILTASGGPFRTWSLEEMRNVTPAEAIAHPNWDMGAKISVDSATMMNKGLELIEAFYLFGLPEDRIDILVHPQSIVHSMVSYVDGSVLAQLGSPDMRTPIAYTLAWPRRMEAPSPRLDLGQIAKLTFETPDSERFPALRLARVALKTGGSAPTILNASNEEAVAGFLAEKVGFPDIARIVEETLEKMSGSEIRSVDDVLMVDAEARRVARDLMSTEGLQV
ncbi:MAG TPA: 1-deoxy-D-xylulose-5-phosphate reductoisomerase [Rhodospirillaceae bacterium]|nr:1-deoxy-D-xylulose-5-phosphate reductoisomerase [Rhodospirillaceae bacterium]|tara:strand:- start:12471 stop:13682 length:1212 start_codon:yes stop_codon:yes gene_type:complete